MTEHKKLIMYHEDRRITDPEIIKKLLSHNQVAVLSLFDDPYPYVVPMNYGYTWDDQLVIYLHMAVTGHRIDLIRNNPRAAINICEFLDRKGFKAYKTENHDYRSISVFGTASIIRPDEDPDEFLKGLNALQLNNHRLPVKKITQDMRNRLLVLKVVAEEITAKAQYPLDGIEEVYMPENVPLD